MVSWGCGGQQAIGRRIVWPTGASSQAAHCWLLGVEVEGRGAGLARLIIETSLREEIALEEREDDAQPALGARSADEGEARKLWLGRAKGRGTSSGTRALGAGTSGLRGAPKKSTPAAPRRGGLGTADGPKKSTPAAPGRESAVSA